MVSRAAQGPAGYWPGTPYCVERPSPVTLTMASPTMAKTSTLACSKASSEKCLLSHPMTRPWIT
jgi:hypothetical protein